MQEAAGRWNHNTHYHPLILAACPPGAPRALDVGCGEGILARELRQVAAHVTGIDLDQPSIALARTQDSGADLDYRLGDFLTCPFEPGSFDFIGSVAALHHMDARAGLTRMRELLRPGGTLVVVGLARPASPADFAMELAGAVAHRAYLRTRTYWEHSAPIVWPPPESYGAMRRLASQVLPGVRYRRHLLWRYSLTWTRPAA